MDKRATPLKSAAVPENVVTLGLSVLVVAVLTALSLSGSRLAEPALASVPVTPTAAAASNYWLAGADGGVFNFGSAQFHGSAGSLHLSAPIVGMTATPDGGGYWLVASDCGIFSYGDARFEGSTGGSQLNAAVVAAAAHSNGSGGFGGSGGSGGSTAAPPRRRWHR
jgi:hypothetical protein